MARERVFTASSFWSLSTKASTPLTILPRSADAQLREIEAFAQLSKASQADYAPSQYLDWLNSLLQQGRSVRARLAAARHVVAGRCLDRPGQLHTLRSFHCFSKLRLSSLLCLLAEQLFDMPQCSFNKSCSRFRLAHLLPGHHDACHCLAAQHSRLGIKEKHVSDFEDFTGKVRSSMHKQCMSGFDHCPRRTTFLLLIRRLWHGKNALVQPDRVKMA